MIKGSRALGQVGLTYSWQAFKIYLSKFLDENGYF